MLGSEVQIMSFSSAVSDPSFGVAFWAALLSGLVYSVITGLLVGVVIWRLPLARERRDLRHEAERELEHLKSRIRPLLTKSNAIVIDSAQAAMPRTAGELMDVINDYPVTLWKARNVVPLGWILCIEDLERSYLECLTRATQLDQELSALVRRENARNLLISVSDAPVIRYYVGRMMGFEDEKLIPCLDLSTSHIPSWISGLHLACTHSEALEQMSLAYLESRKSLLSAIERFIHIA